MDLAVTFITQIPETKSRVARIAETLLSTIFPQFCHFSFDSVFVAKSYKLVELRLTMIYLFAGPNIINFSQSWEGTFAGIFRCCRKKLPNIYII